MPPKTLVETVSGRVAVDPDWVGRGTFNVAVSELQKKGETPGIELRYMNAGQLALARMAFGPGSGFSTEGLWVPNDHIYGVGNDTDFLIVDERHSIIFGDPVRATNTHRAGQAVYASEAYDRLRQLAFPHALDALKTGVLLVTRSSYRKKLPTDAFGRLDVPVFIFGEKTAADYGNWLKEARGIDSVHHSVLDTDYTANKKKQFALALWISGIYRRSDLDGNYYALSYYYGSVRRVSIVPAELAAPKLL